MPDLPRPPFDKLRGEMNAVTGGVSVFRLVRCCRRSGVRAVARLTASRRTCTRMHLARRPTHVYCRMRERVDE